MCPKTTNKRLLKVCSIYGTQNHWMARHLKNVHKHIPEKEREQQLKISRNRNVQHRPDQNVGECHLCKKSNEKTLHNIQKDAPELMESKAK